MNDPASPDQKPLKLEEDSKKVQAEDTPVGAVKNVVDPEGCDVLYLSNVPVYWKVEKMSSYIREITKSEKILDHITFITYVKPNFKNKSLDPNAVNSGSFLVKFTNDFFCGLAYTEWTDICEKKNIKVHYDLDNLFEKKIKYKKPFIKSKFKQNNVGEPPAKRQKVFQDNHSSNESDNNETYGLTMQFLNNLNIKLPIGNKLFITNLHPDVSIDKIREVFGLAGQVVNVVLQKYENYAPPRFYAKIQYDHPVEAVQAISMFNNQKLYTWPMIVRMDSKPTNDIPEGLNGMGPGLGPNGEPLKGIRNYIELQPFKHLWRETDKAKEFGGSNSNMINFNPFWQSENSIFKPMPNNSLSVQAPMVPQMPVAPVTVPNPMLMAVQAPNQQNMNQFGQQTMINPFSIPGLQNLQMLQNPANLQQAVNLLLQTKMNSDSMGQNSDQGGNNSSEWQAQTNQSNNQSNYSASAKKDSFGNNHKFDYSNRSYSSSERHEKRDQRDSHKSRDENNSSKEKSDMLLFKNLPPSVTLQALRNKMQEVGDVKFAEMTGQGRAIVRFTHSRDAERCIKLFNKSKVDGQVIDVRYF